MATRVGSVIAATLAAALVGCGYQPEPDRRSDPLSPRDNEDAALHIDVMDFTCSEGIDADLSEFSFHGLKRIARKNPHGVFRATGARLDDYPITDLEDFDGDTMIQVLERLAHMESDCEYAKRLGYVAEVLRSPPR